MNCLLVLQRLTLRESAMQCPLKIKGQDHRGTPSASVCWHFIGFSALKTLYHLAIVNNGRAKHVDILSRDMPGQEPIQESFQKQQAMLPNLVFRVEDTQC